MSIIDKIKKGDQKAFEQFYDEHVSAIYGLIFSIVKKDAVAQDITQDVFVKVWKKIATYDSKKGTIFTWTLNIARNACIDFLRKNKKMQVVENQKLESLVSIDENNATKQKIEHIGIREIVEKLEPEYRLVIEYLYFKGYTQKELSDELNIPLGTVKTRSRKALKELLNKVRILILWM